MLAAPAASEARFHVTALSNLARAFDKYARRYDKRAIPESTYPEQFFLVRREDLALGLAKAAHLPQKTALAGDRLVVLETRVRSDELHPNLRSGRGEFLQRGWIDLVAVHWPSSGGLTPVSIEEAVALALRSISPSLKPYAELVPRSVSILPVARACDARCPFCFSRASVSLVVEPLPFDLQRAAHVLRRAKERGAARAVITGGGEPGLLGEARLCELVELAARDFERVVLITSGHWLARLGRSECGRALARLARAGLGVLALSRHAPDEDTNARCMGRRTESRRVADVWRELALPRLRLRWICVLQRGAVEDEATLEDYLAFAAHTGVEEVCFKELYVSTSTESLYHDRETNEWSRSHQVPLSLVTGWAARQGFHEVERLPWGAPVFAGAFAGRALRIAAYCEPSVLWERRHGLARSWNLLADGRCLASLEDQESEVEPHGLRALPQ